MTLTFDLVTLTLGQLDCLIDINVMAKYHHDPSIRPGFIGENTRCWHTYTHRGESTYAYQATKSYHPICGKTAELRMFISGTPNEEPHVWNSQKVLWLTRKNLRQGKENSKFQHCEVSFTAQKISFKNINAQGKKLVHVSTIPTYKWYLTRETDHRYLLTFKSIAH